MDGEYGASTRPGYSVVGVDENNLDAKYLCSFCCDLLRDTVKTEGGDFYCESCLEQRLRNDSTPFSCVKDGKVINKKSEEYDVSPVCEDLSDAQSSCSSNKSEKTELTAQENVNSIPLSRRVANILAQNATVDQALKPEEVSTLQLAFGRLMSPPSSRPDCNRNGLPEQDRATGISSDSKIMEDKFGYSTSDMTHNKKIECRLADVETKVAQLQPLHEELIRSRQFSADQVQGQVQVLKDDVAKLQSDFGEMKSLFQGQFTEIVHCLNRQTPYRVHEELSRFIIDSKVDMEERIQTLEQRSQSLEVMMDKLTKTITKLHLVCEVCGAPNVQGAP